MMDANTISTLITAAVTLLATFVGAGFAFRLNDKARARQTVRDQVAAVNRAIFILGRQFNLLKVIQTETIDPFREDPTRFIGMRPSLPVGLESPTLDLDSLSFLLETDARELLMELLIEQDRFEMALQSMNERSRLHLEVLQPRMAEAGIIEGGRADDLLRAIGEPLALRMQNATENTIQQIDKTVESNLEFAEKFRLAMKQLFPKARIIRLLPK